MSSITTTAIKAPGVPIKKNSNEEISRTNNSKKKHKRGSLTNFVKETAVQSLDGILIGGIPIDEWERTGWAFPIIIFYYAVFVMAFFYFLYTFALGGMNSQFLSFTSSSDFQLCAEIPVVLSASVQADSFGNWETNASFFQNSSIYVLKFDDSQVNSSRYASAMINFKERLKVLSTKSSRRDWAWNTIMWSTFGFFDEVTLMRFYSSADARYLYRGTVNLGFVSSASAGACRNPAQIGEVDNEGRLIFTVPTIPISSTNLNATDACSNQFPAKSWQKKNLNSFTDTLEVDFDLQTITCVMSVNMGITVLTDYVKTSSIYGTAAIGGLPGYFYYDIFYPSMSPFFCVDKHAVREQKIVMIDDAQLNGPDLCFVVQQTEIGLQPLLYYPITQSFSQNTTSSIYDHCKCPQDALNPDCNKRNIVIGLFYDKDIELYRFNNLTKGITATIPTNQLNLALTLQKYLLDDPIDGDYKMQTHFTNFFITSLDQTDNYGRFMSPNKIYPNKKTLKDANLQANATYGDLHQASWASICPKKTCGSFIFHISSDENVDAFLPMNNYHYQAGLAPYINDTFTDTNVIKRHISYKCNSDGKNYNVSTGTCSSEEIIYHNTIQKRQMCENTIYNSAVMDSFITTPPVPVRELYFKCTKTATGAIMDSCGNAAAIAGIVSMVAIILFGYFFRKINNHRARLLQGKDDTAVILKHKGKSDEIDYEKTMAGISETVKKVVKSMKLLQEKQKDLKEQTLQLSLKTNCETMPSEWGSPVKSSGSRASRRFSRESFVSINRRFSRESFPHMRNNNSKMNRNKRVSLVKKTLKGRDSECKEGELEYTLTDRIPAPEDMYHDIESPRPH